MWWWEMQIPANFTDSNSYYTDACTGTVPVPATKKLNLPVPVIIFAVHLQNIKLILLPDVKGFAGNNSFITGIL